MVDERVNGRVKTFPPALLHTTLGVISAVNIKLAEVKRMFNPIYKVKT